MEEIKKKIFQGTKSKLGDKAAKMYACGYADGFVEGVCTTAEEIVKALDGMVQVPANVIVQHLSAMIEKYKSLRVKYKDGNKERL